VWISTWTRVIGPSGRKWRNGGTWTAELIAVEYDWESVARAAAARGREDWSVALRSGRATPSESREPA
jgi:hypothetical protein